MRLRLLLMLCVLASSMAACGVRVRSAPEGTEFFKSLQISGDMRAGSRLSLALGYEQNNDVDVSITCELRQGKELVKTIGTTAAAAIPNGGPDQTPVPGTYSVDFTVDAPGTYKAECFTPADEDNFIIKMFTAT